MENLPKNQIIDLRPGVGISQDPQMRLLKNADPQRETRCASWRGFCISLFLILLLIGCGSGGGESSTSTLYAEITELEVLYGVNYGYGPGYRINAVFKNKGNYGIENAYWHIYGEPYTWIIDNPRLYISVNNSIMATTEIFKDSFYGRRYFTISLYDQNDNMLATRTVISGYI